MKLVAGANKPPAGGPSSPQENPTGPTGVPMTTPQANEGAQAEAQAKLSLAMKLMSQSLVAYGSASKEGAALMDAIGKIQKAFGVKLDEGAKMIPAELKVLMEAAGQQTPEMQAAGAGGAPGGQPQLKAA